jgi:hypothetical protein
MRVAISARKSTADNDRDHHVRTLSARSRDGAHWYGARPDPRCPSPGLVLSPRLRIGGREGCGFRGLAI